mmetsp:Transcript_18247/g.24043  ORF Transcript_18247/g.24043 Transcript_18247/m.24043 type:complete len:284 (-) Transcript_18247:369-1220(-)|eukprot:CAMPEP_0117752908 /NCGR_PEP_ID=MMETSP0947-20121206/11904_1 /TAXON_ID=44440 /ORGANISM="Chattonella subsalsa, Strain CCMP2191" /LENGTH=283 /DNA_ID=CAMNT_0005571677 /DNA_START=59 /DNA_END=910 /DNA_ORIENTATION=-
MSLHVMYTSVVILLSLQILTHAFQSQGSSLLFKSYTNFQRKPPLSAASSEDEEPSVLNVEQDWRELRAKLISQGFSYGEEFGDTHSDAKGRWAHRLANVEVGSIILDSGGETFSEAQQYFQHSVILIIRHDEQGTVGLILNRPTGYRMGDMVADANLRSLPGFEKSELYMGGDVGGRRLDGMDCINLMHQKQYVGVSKVVNGLYLGGLNEALNDIKAGRAQPEEFRFFTKYCGWARGQLDSEIDAGFWFVAASDVDTIMDHRISHPKNMWLEIIGRINEVQSH